MRKKNGTTIIELLVSLGIISIVVIFLFRILNQVRYEDTESKSKNNMVFNQAVLTNSINQDIIKYGINNISECDSSDIIDISTEFCIKYEVLNYSKDSLRNNDSYFEDTVYSYIYGYKDDEIYKITYQIKGNFEYKTITKSYNDEIIFGTPKLIYSNKNDMKNFYSLTIPVSTYTEENYDIVLSFSDYNNNVSNFNASQSENFTVEKIQ